METKESKQDAANNGRVAAEKGKALELALSTIEKQFGKGSIMRLGANQNMTKDFDVISTGSLGLDIALGIGGLPKGRIVEIFGPESSGKTTIALSVLAQAQKKGGVVAFVDAEHALDPKYARKLGVNIEDLLISQPDNGEQALEITETLVRSGAIDVLVVDSVAALVPRAEIEGEMGDSHMGLQARLMSQALRKLTAAINRSNTLVIFINQIRMKIGVMFGNPETTTGGNALKFYSSVRLDVRRVGAIKNGEEITGNRTAVKVVKNKMAPPFTKVEFDLMYNEGISIEGDILDLATTANLVEKSGSWFSYNGERMGQGRDQAKNFLKENPKATVELREKLLAKNGIGAMLMTGETGSPEDGPDQVAPPMKAGAKALGTSVKESSAKEVMKEMATAKDSAKEGSKESGKEKEMVALVPTKSAKDAGKDKPAAKKH